MVLAGNFSCRFFISKNQNCLALHYNDSDNWGRKSFTIQSLLDFWVSWLLHLKGPTDRKFRVHAGIACFRINFRTMKSLHSSFLNNVLARVKLRFFNFSIFICLGGRKTVFPSSGSHSKWPQQNQGMASNTMQSPCGWKEPVHVSHELCCPGPHQEEAGVRIALGMEPCIRCVTQHLYC